jgi:tetratricopeptide (TPR) repeat protein
VSIALRYGAMFLSFGAALASKEIALGLIALIPLLDWLVVSANDPTRLRRNFWRLHFPLIAIGLLCLTIWLLAQPGQRPEKAALSVVAQTTRFLETLGFYAQMIVDPYQPNPLRGAYYDASDPSWFRVALGALAMIGVLFAAFKLRARRPRAAWALLFGSIMLAPASNLIPHSLVYLVAERFIYLPLFGVALALGVVLMSSSARLQRLLAALAALFLISWGVTTFVRCRDYESPLRFWSAAALTTPNNPVVAGKLAKVLIDRGRYEVAETWLRRALKHDKRLRLVAEHVSDQLRLLQLWVRRHADAPPEDLRHIATYLDQLVMRAPEEPSVHGLELSGIALELDLRYPAARRRLRLTMPVVLETLGQAQSAVGQDQRGLANLRAAARIAPRSASTRYSLVIAEARALQLEAAVQTLHDASRLNPDAPATSELQKLLEVAKPRVERLRELGFAGPPSVRETPDTEAKRSPDAEGQRSPSPELQRSPDAGGQRSPDAQLSPAQEAEAHRLFAELFILLKVRGRALAHLRQLVLLAPGDRSARSMLALTLAASGRREEALAVVARARRDFGNEPGLDTLQAQVEEQLRARGANK